MMCIKTQSILDLQSANFFGFARRKQGDKYLGFAFAKNASIILDEAALLIDRR